MQLEEGLRMEVGDEVVEMEYPWVENWMILCEHREENSGRWIREGAEWGRLEQLLKSAD